MELKEDERKVPKRWRACKGREEQGIRVVERKLHKGRNHDGVLNREFVR